MREIFKYTEDYLKKTEKRRNNMYVCPKCSKPIAAIRTFVEYSLFCMSCQKIGNLFELVRLFEEDKNYLTDEEIEQYLKEFLKLDIMTEIEIGDALDFYEKNGFDLVPIIKNGKIPIEKEWTTKEHKNKKEWKDWLNNGLNIGIKTGKCSNVIVIDFDGEIPEELSKSNTLKQKTKNGMHFFFKYDSDLPKTRIDKLKIDIENNGGQVVAYPSIVEDCKRTINLEEISELPNDWKKFILSKINKRTTLNLEEEKKFEINEDFHEDLIKEGNRHHIMMSLGGILRRKLNMYDTTFVLDVLNKKLSSPSMSRIEFDNIVKSLEKYTSYDDVEIAKKILDYIRRCPDQEATAADIQFGLYLKKAEVDKTLGYLLKEEYIIKKNRTFHLLQKVDWRDTFMGESNPIKFKMPYFHDSATFRDGDMLVIGAKAKVGKTHIAMNIIKRLVAQGIKPYYACLESGSRFPIISQSLALKEGDYWNSLKFKPESSELKENSITIIDWLLPGDYANTDKIFAHLSNQLIRFGGLLIVFVQIRDSNAEFFAKDMVAFFPSFVCKYLYNDDSDGSTGYFKIEYMRESVDNRKKLSIPCKYDMFSKELKRLDEIGD